MILKLSTLTELAELALCPPGHHGIFSASTTFYFVEEMLLQPPKL